MVTRTLDEIAHSDVWDSRDAIARIGELEDTYESCRMCRHGDDGHAVCNDVPGNDGDSDRVMDPEDYSELLAWREFLDCGYLPSDWDYGESFVADHYFTTYAQELAEDIGAIPDDAQWPTTCIDWDQAANDLRMDYTSYDLAGHTFWARS